MPVLRELNVECISYVNVFEFLEYVNGLGLLLSIYDCYS
jgi:hypothetical protein